MEGREGWRKKEKWKRRKEGGRDRGKEGSLKSDEISPSLAQRSRITGESLHHSSDPISGSRVNTSLTGLQ